MTDANLLHPALLSLVLLTGTASAAGLGEITLLSPIGAPLRAVVPVFGIEKALQADCFSLDPASNSDLPVVAEGRIRLARVGENSRLIIIGSKPIVEPVFVIRLRIACGIDLQREYVLLPGAPAALPPDIDDAALPPVDQRPRRAPAIDKAGLVNGPSTEMRRPAARRHPRHKAASSLPATDDRPPTTLTGLADGRDRIILGPALDEPPPPAAGPALEERLLKMETSLHRLNDQVDKLDQALSLGKEARALEDGLRRIEGSPGLTAAAPVTSEAGGDATDWLELLLGIVIGGSVSAGIAHLVGKRHDRQRDGAPTSPAGRPNMPRQPARTGA